MARDGGRGGRRSRDGVEGTEVEGTEVEGRRSRDGGQRATGDADEFTSGRFRQALMGERWKRPANHLTQTDCTLAFSG
jgi:hypothetical protein